jgi:hypothetical protein
MSKSVVAVVEERERKEGLETHLDCQRPRRDSRNHRLRLHVPSGDRGCEVSETKEVQRAGENDGGQTVEARAVPGDLRLVDGEMRGDGALEALFGENLGGFGFGGRESVGHVSTGLLAAKVVLPWASYLRCTMLRPAGCTRNAGAATRRKPSWKMRIVAMLAQSFPLSSWCGSCVAAE